MMVTFSNLHAKSKAWHHHLFRDLNHIIQSIMLLYWDGINFRFQDSDFMTPEFILFNNRGMCIVYVLFLENEGEMIKQMSKVQLMQKVLYLIDQMAHVVEENIVLLWCNAISHCMLCT